MTTDIVNLYYVEKCAVLVAGADRDGRLTEEYRVLRNVTRDEAEDYIRKFSHFRSHWRIEDANFPRVEAIVL